MLDERRHARHPTRAARRAGYAAETTNFTDQTSVGGNGNGPRHSDALTLTERFTRLDSQTLEYVVTVDDPRTYVQPFTMLLDLTTGRDNAVLPYECHEGNYMLRNTLSAERAEDRALEADVKNGVTRARRAVQGNINALPAAAPAEER